MERDTCEFENGTVIVNHEPPYMGRCYYIHNAKKHWIYSVETASFYNIDLNNIIEVSLASIGSIPVGAPIVMPLNAIENCKNYLEARAFLLKDLHGEGVEFGAAVAPLPVPPNCTVKYADCYETDEGCNAAMPSDEFVPITYKTNIESMEGIKNRSLDFILHSHVIEHTPKTLYSIELAYKKLKKNGMLFMVVPKKECTFDKKRELTKLEHFISDYKKHNKEKDLYHLMDFIVNTNDRLGGDELLEHCKRFLEGTKYDIHYHTFNETNFAELLRWFNSNVRRWRKTEIIPQMDFEGSIEFYVRLYK